jgi:hypothetical protein
MTSKAFKASKSDDGFFTVAGFNGDSITTKKKETARDFALYLIAQYHAKESRRRFFHRRRL